MSEAKLQEDHRDPYAIPLDEIDVSDPSLFQTDSHFPFFERLRKEAPVHYCKSSAFGPFWSVTKFDDIMAIEKDHETFSSFPAIVIGDQDPEFTVEQFIAVDPPKHDEQRKAVTPAVSPPKLVEDGARHPRTGG
jgi:cytochrome P450